MKDINLDDMPIEVLWVFNVKLMGVCGSSTLDEVNRIIEIYPEWFPWETKYNSIPEEVHRMYRDELDPGWDKPIEFKKRSKVGEGLYAMVVRSNTVQRQSKISDIISAFTDLQKSCNERIIEEGKKFKREVEIWNKYYSKYELPHPKINSLGFKGF